jgi:hypothetical protein
MGDRGFALIDSGGIPEADSIKKFRSVRAPSELRHNSKDNLFTVVKSLWRSSDGALTDLKILKSRPQRPALATEMPSSY